MLFSKLLILWIVNCFLTKPSGFDLHEYRVIDESMNSPKYQHKDQSLKVWSKIIHSQNWTIYQKIWSTVWIIKKYDLSITVEDNSWIQHHMSWNQKPYLCQSSHFTYLIFHAYLEKVGKLEIEAHRLVFCYQNCSDLLWEKIVLLIEKNFWNRGWRPRIQIRKNYWDLETCRKS